MPSESGSKSKGATGDPSTCRHPLKDRSETVGEDFWHVDCLRCGARIEGEDLR